MCNTCTSQHRCRMAVTGGRSVLTCFSSPARSAFPAQRKLTQAFLSPRGDVSSKSSPLKHFPYPSLDASTNTCANFFSDFKVVLSCFFFNSFFCCYVMLFSLSPSPSPPLGPSPQDNRVTRLSKHCNRQCTDCFQMHKKTNRERRDKN